jgi:hypothetical protein
MNNQPHNCPVCDATGVPYEKLMCFRCWTKVPSPLQRRLYATWRDGAGAGSAEHEAAMADCLRALGVGGQGGACAK